MLSSQNYSIAFSTLGCPDMSLDDIVSMTSAFAFDGVELRGGPSGHISPVISNEQRKKIRTYFSRTHIDPFSVTAYTHFNDKSKVKRKEQETLLIDYCQLANDIGAKYVRSFIGPIPNEGHRERVTDWAILSFQNVCDSIEGMDISIAIENHDSWSSVFSMKPIFDALPRTSLLWDVAHSLRSGDIPESVITTFISRFAYLHIKDEISSKGSSYTAVLPGSGNIHIKPILEQLASTPFEGYLCFEWEKAWNPNLPSLKEALGYFKRWIN